MFVILTGMELATGRALDTLARLLQTSLFVGLLVYCGFRGMLALRHSYILTLLKAGGSVPRDFRQTLESAADIQPATADRWWLHVYSSDAVGFSLVA
jgi:hypothetical protein